MGYGDKALCSCVGLHALDTHTHTHTQEHILLLGMKEFYSIIMATGAVLRAGANY